MMPGDQREISIVALLEVSEEGLIRLEGLPIVQTNCELFLDGDNLVPEAS